MSKTTKQTQQPALDHVEKAVNKPELGHAKDGDLPEGTKRKWTAAEDRILRDNSGKLIAREIGVKLGRSAQAICQRASNIGVSLKIKKPKLADQIRTLAGKMSTHDIAKKLNSSPKYIKTVAGYEGISLRFERKLWTPEQDNFLRKNCSLLTSTEIGKVLGKSNECVRKHATNLGISLAKHHRAHQQWHGYKNQKSVPLKFKNRPLPDDCN